MSSGVKEKIFFALLFSYVKFGDCEIYHEFEIGEFSPQISASHVDFKGSVIKGLGMERNSNIFLPTLSSVENAWEGTATVFHCRARYPVQWKYYGPGGPSVKAETFRESHELWNVKMYNFTAKLTFSHSSSNQVGLYTCESLSAPEFLKSSFFAYLEQEEGFVHKEDVEVEGSSLSSIIIPCIVTNPKLSPSLYKKSQNGEYKEIMLGKDVKFNPKIGFYTNGNLMKDLYGHYKCKVKNSYRDSQLNVHVKKNDILVSQLDLHKDLKIESKDGKIYCCAPTGSRPPKFKFDSCESQTWCSILETHLDRKTFFEESSTVGSCAVFEPDELVDDSGLLQCSDEGKKKVKILVACDAGICTRAPGNEGTSLKVSIQPSRGTLMRVSCSYDTFRFSHGVKWTIDDKLVESKGRVYIDLEMRDNLGKKITCYAPIWDSPTEWKAASIQI